MLSIVEAQLTNQNSTIIRKRYRYFNIEDLDNVKNIVTQISYKNKNIFHTCYKLLGPKIGIGFRVAE